MGVIKGEDHFRYMVNLCLKIATEGEEEPDHNNIATKPTETQSAKKNDATDLQALPNLIKNNLTTINVSQEEPKDVKSSSKEKRKRNERKKPNDETRNKENPRKKPVRKTVVMAGPDPPPGMSEKLNDVVRQVLGGTNVKLIIQKEVKQSDVDPQQSRFSMPKNQLGSDNFLEEEEKMKVVNGEGLEVTVIEPSEELERRHMLLKCFNYERSSSYVFGRHWNNFVQRNKLGAGNIVQVWFFRDKNARPCFPLVRLG